MPKFPSPRTTIVGGQPSEDKSELPPVPVGLQRLLRLASVDRRFRRELLQRRAELAETVPIQLTKSERAILNAVPAQQLGAMVDHMPPPAPSRRDFLRQTAFSSVLLLGAAGTAGALGACRRERILNAGQPDDLPPMRRDELPQDVMTAGQPVDLPPETPDAGQADQPPPTKVDSGVSEPPIQEPPVPRKKRLRPITGSLFD